MPLDLAQHVVMYRRAERGDARGIAEVHVDSWRAAYKGILPDAMLASLSVSQRETAWAETLSDPNRTTLVVLLDANVVGFADVSGSRDGECDAQIVGEITGIYLAPHVWRCGLGRVLCDRCDDVLRATRHTEVIVWVLAENKNAIGFYEGLGFVRDGAERLHEGLLKQAVRYRRPIVAH